MNLALTLAMRNAIRMLLYNHVMISLPRRIMSSSKKWKILMKDLYRLKGKGIESNVQPSQDNREDMVKKLEKGSTVACSKCHKECHKSNKCLQPRKNLPDEKNKKKLTIKSSLIYTKPNWRNKNNSTSYVIKKKTNGKVVAHKVGKKKRS